MKFKELLISYDSYLSELDQTEYDNVKRNIKLYYSVYNQPLEHFLQSWDLIQRNQCFDFYQQMNQTLDGLSINEFKSTINSILDIKAYLQLVSENVESMRIEVIEDDQEKQEDKDYFEFRKEKGIKIDISDDLYL